MKNQKTIESETFKSRNRGTFKDFSRSVQRRVGIWRLYSNKVMKAYASHHWKSSKVQLVNVRNSAKKGWKILTH